MQTLTADTCSGVFDIFHLKINIRVVVVCLLIIFFASTINDNDISSTKSEITISFFQKKKLMFFGYWVVGLEGLLPSGPPKLERLKRSTRRKTPKH